MRKVINCLIGLFLCLSVLVILTQCRNRSGTDLSSDISDLQPTLHFKPEGLSMGDVIPFYWDGMYHLFFMKGQNWGHVASRDLLRWQQFPDAIIKGDDPTGPDYEGIWTGSVIEHDGTFYLFYTGKNSNDPKGDQKVMQARSKDLINWTKHPELTFYADGDIYWSKPVNGAIDHLHAYHHQAFRDPHVIWNSEKAEWWMVFHAIKADGSLPVMALYTSPDLNKWEPQEPLAIYPPEVSGDCPDIFKINDTWNINCADYHYMQVEQSGTVNPLVRAYDCGDLRVAKTMDDGKRKIILGWIGGYEGEKDNGNFQWGGLLSMPRELYWDKQGLLYQRPPEEIFKYYQKHIVKHKKININQQVGAAADFMLKAKVEASGSSSQVTLYFRETEKRTDTDQAEPENRYHLKINFITKEIEFGNKYRSYKRVCDFDPLNPVQICLFVDDTVAECFVNDAYCFTMRIYECKGNYISFDSPEKDLKIKDLEVRTR